MTARERTYLEFDAGIMADAFSQPGIDPREWVSYGIVDPDGASDDEKSVEFDDEYGPLVNVTLHPSGKQVRARVASFMAGNGEGEWFPFIEKDEVLVALAGGSERNCIIIGRMNQGVDGFPERVGGVDTAKNAVAFRRCRTPFVWEFAEGPFLVTNAKNNASLFMDKGGNWYVKDGEGSTLYVGSDWMGFQTKDPTEFALQYQHADKLLNVNLGGGLTQVVLKSTDTSTVTTAQVLAVGTAGSMPFWHATSIESVAVLLTELGKVATTPWTAAQVAAAIASAKVTPIDPVVLAPLMAALAAPAIPPTLPGLGCAGLVIG
jgi:hypothetical protein